MQRYEPVGNQMLIPSPTILPIAAPILKTGINLLKTKTTISRSRFYTQLR